MSENAPPRSSTTLIVVVVLVICLLGAAVVAVPVIGVLAAIAIPNFVAMQLKAKRSEVPANVDGLKTAELAYDAAFDTFIAFGDEQSARRGLGKSQREWAATEGSDKLGWRPDGLVRGGYWVEVHGSSFVVHGICDVDGDGEYAEYTATSSINSTLVSPPDVY
jgi:type II secretory pathway pseudopilin PulG